MSRDRMKEDWTAAMAPRVPTTAVPSEVIERLADAVRELREAVDALREARDGRE